MSISCDKSERMMVINRLIENGVVFIDVSSVYIDDSVVIGAGTKVYPNVCIEGNTSIGCNCVIHMGCIIKDTVIGDECVLRYVLSDNATIGDNVTIGPFVNLRPNAKVSSNCKIGDFVEIKNSSLGDWSKVPHLTYVGDSDIGKHVNIGCGTVFVNYDGYKKQRSRVGDNVFIGCNTNIVAPVNIKDNAYTAAGTTVTTDVEDGDLAVGRARQVNIKGWVQRHKAKNTDGGSH